jgi:hypothetical protein
MSPTPSIANIVANLRTNVLQEIAGIPDADPWDEEENGAAWLENELALFDELYHLMYPRYQPRNWRKSHTVAEFVPVLEGCSGPYLLELRKFAHYGGSSNPEFFELRKQGSTGITRSFFAELPTP